MIIRKTDNHLDIHSIIPEGQKGCCKNSKGYKETAVIDSVITMHLTEPLRLWFNTSELVYQNLRNLSHSIHNIKTFKSNYVNLKNYNKPQNRNTNIKTEIAIRRIIFQGERHSAYALIHFKRTQHIKCGISNKKQSKSVIKSIIYSTWPTSKYANTKSHNNLQRHHWKNKSRHRNIIWNKQMQITIPLTREVV